MYSVMEALNQIKPEDIPIIKLWSNDNRIKDIVGGDKECSHSIILNQKCKYCGAFVGYIGEESKWIDFIDHMWLISALLKDNEFYVYSRKMLPTYITHTNKLVGDVYFNHHWKVWYNVIDNYYIHYFYNKRQFSDYVLNITKRDLISYKNKVLINPLNNDIKSGKLMLAKKYFICNKGQTNV